MGSDCYIHILYGCPLKPATRVLKCFDSPNTSSPIEAKEIYEDSIDLLFHLKMKAQIDVLEASQQIFILVHKSPPSLNQSQLRIILQHKEKQINKNKPT